MASGVVVARRPYCTKRKHDLVVRHLSWGEIYSVGIEGGEGWHIRTLFYTTTLEEAMSRFMSEAARAPAG